jgi:hypothetical protein
LIAFTTILVLLFELQYMFYQHLFRVPLINYVLENLDLILAEEIADLIVV